MITRGLHREGAAIVTQQAGVLAIAGILAAGMMANPQAAEPAEPVLPATPYIGGPVELMERPNGAIANKRR
jgi:hypothetical protein